MELWGIADRSGFLCTGRWRQLHQALTVGQAGLVRADGCPLLGQVRSQGLLNPSELLLQPVCLALQAEEVLPG
eukprot:CAMPEP_0197947986 /NCGR_PEP_ID=MMETSP1439-20131203/127183_1 /TAXON_ID=66791 /ORGANISM="Gonyaulax spinifera, Strain CCMP409" /LENGTH=72 /DNA_ID=CAMNT_0043571237 /DNA_START=1007 /DNA_END=1221 /DNA_ORIENTATION=+